MPKDKNTKKKEPKKSIEYRLLVRPLEEKKAPLEVLQYIRSFRELKYAEEWIQSEGKETQVYIVNKFVDGEFCRPNSTKYMQCECCNIYLETFRNFSYKYLHNKYSGWHQSQCVHPDEILDRVQHK
jgi:hypothetical protein